MPIQHWLTRPIHYRAWQTAFIIIIALVVASGMWMYLLATKQHVPLAQLQREQWGATTKYRLPRIQPKNTYEYQIVMVGHSMTRALGPHGGSFSTFINDLYRPSHRGIIIDNYAVGSTNVLSLQKQMTTAITLEDKSVRPALLSRQFDVILIESFGYNPLSQFPMDEGLRKQREALDETMKILLKTHPHSRIVFVATIAPNKETYAQKILPYLTVSDRILEAQERMTYIKSHMSYAREHNIPLVDIYDKSLIDGDGDISLINPDDNIHPSFTGVDFIGHELANFIYDNKILPR